MGHLGRGANRQLTAVGVGGTPAAWAAAGFAVTNGAVQVGATSLVIDPGGAALGPLAISGVTDPIDRMDVVREPAPSPYRASTHANHVVAIDHLVVTTPDPDRTTAALAAAGIELRRVRRFPVGGTLRRQSFFWLGDVILELVGPDEAAGDGPAVPWGLAFTTADLAATVSYLGDAVSPPRPAVQRGRRITALRRAALPLPVSFMSPHVTLRPARPDEVPELVAIELDAGRRFGAAGLAEVATDPVDERELAAAVSAGLVWVAERSATVVGYAEAGLVDGEAHLHQVSIAESASGYGIGQALEQVVAQWAKAAGSTTMTLTAFRDVAFNAPLYERWGYQLIDEAELGPELRAIRAAEDTRWSHLGVRVAMRREI